MSKYVKKLTNDELLERMADDLVEMHRDTGIELEFWETAKEVVQRYYHISASVVVHGKKEPK
jgi:Tat protein secretion system quality control protein TatD with DNase activity